AGRACSGSAPAACAVARQITGRTRLPPPASAYRTDSAWPWSSGVSASSSRYDSISLRSSSGPRIGLGLRLPLRLLQLLLDRATELGELSEDVDRLVRLLGGREPLELGTRRLQARQQLLRPRQRLLATHAAPAPARSCRV